MAKNSNEIVNNDEVIIVGDEEETTPEAVEETTTAPVATVEDGEDGEGNSSAPRSADQILEDSLPYEYERGLEHDPVLDVFFPFLIQTLRVDRLAARLGRIQDKKEKRAATQELMNAMNEQEDLGEQLRELL